jgi:DNA-binding Lrp family transcriptional regulator
MEKKRAYLLMNVHSSKEEEVEAALGAMSEVVNCDQVTGDMDMIVVVEAPDYGHILGPLLAEIRKIDGISHTSTCLVL